MDLEFATSDLDEALAFVNEMYIGARVRPGGGGPGFRHEVIGRVTALLQVTQFWWTRGVSIDIDPFGYLMSFTVNGGGVEVTTKRDDAAVARGQVLLCPPGQPMQVTWGDDFAATLFTLPLERVAELAVGQAGVPAADFRFTSMRPVSTAMAVLWRQTMSMVAGQLEGPGTLASPLVEEATCAMAAATALMVFPNTTMTLGYVPGPGQAAPAALRRAVAFIDGHADQPVTLAQIAAAAGVSGRALQAAFARRYATTPTRYLRRVRLERAHRELQAADPACGATVAEIARRWGWANPSRFAAAYRQAYGQLPGRTLRS
jgi:AraC-like DNA-binding protein